MKNTLKKVAVTSAIALAPVLAAGSAFAAPQADAVQAQSPNCYMVKVNGADVKAVIPDPAKSADWQAWLDNLVKEWKNQANNGSTQQQPVVKQPSVENPGNVVNKPESKPTRTPTKPAQPAPSTENGTAADKSDYASQVVDLVNKERAKAGLNPLQSDEKLTKVAMIKAQDMYNNNYFDHQSPTLGSPFDLMKAQGVQYRTAGENIAKGQRTPEEVMNAWMNSEGHRQNILNPNYTAIGVAYYNGEWVQEFTG
ncbi:CAP domain-containing protein [Paenibacillus melissococcoides]|uniref:CAP domain-containing protein n=1 Tax=Paenibacillus melissococcoides TaxID=2912268 RepID=A0ABM9FXN9_9BACL|nr:MULTISPECIES: CAP domain-containing protein [Paenibacillus]MEB9894259.1 CAP domain-containing protein [Bacillus cereus]CAH8243947.1 CAP domain-containing protein [Paenibacillus melissococcoides]CAH8704156.1 CAP domain-containing protein [Paenibacillus melissococcoides]CAH8706896.1 CAP domain-containing protein [Paenibacillus melissococcoides]GIO80157.1 serine protease [Paenibacillus dendritiformis]